MKKVSISSAKYILIEKITYKTIIYRFKNKIADKLNVSTRTLDRNNHYENEKYIYLKVSNMELSKMSY